MQEETKVQPGAAHPKKEENPYVGFIRKKLRNVEKKLSKIESIESKQKAKEKINDEQKQLLHTKGNLVKSKVDYESLLEQFTKIAKEQEEQSQDTSRKIVMLLQVSDYFSNNEDARKRLFEEQKEAIEDGGSVKVQTEDDLKPLFSLASVLSHRKHGAKGNKEGFKVAVAAATQLGRASADETYEGVTYEEINARLEEVFNTNVFRPKKNKNKKKKAEGNGTTELPEAQNGEEDLSSAAESKEEISSSPVLVDEFESFDEQDDGEFQEVPGKGKNHRGQRGRGGRGFRGGGRGGQRGGGRGGRGGFRGGRQGGRGGQRGGDKRKNQNDNNNGNKQNQNAAQNKA